MNAWLPQASSLLPTPFKFVAARHFLRGFRWVPRSDSPLGVCARSQFKRPLHDNNLSRARAATSQGTVSSGNGTYLSQAPQ